MFKCVKEDKDEQTASKFLSKKKVICRIAFVLNFLRRGRRGSCLLIGRNTVVPVGSLASLVIRYHQLRSKVTRINWKSCFDQ